MLYPGEVVVAQHHPQWWRRHCHHRILATCQDEIISSTYSLARGFAVDSFFRNPESTVFPHSNFRRVTPPLSQGLLVFPLPRSMRSINLYSATFFSLSYYRRSKILGNFQRFEGHGLRRRVLAGVEGEG